MLQTPNRLSLQLKQDPITTLRAYDPVTNFSSEKVSSLLYGSPFPMASFDLKRLRLPRDQQTLLEWRTLQEQAPEVH